MNYKKILLFGVALLASCTATPKTSYESFVSQSSGISVENTTVSTNDTTVENTTIENTTVDITEESTLTTENIDDTVVLTTQDTVVDTTVNTTVNTTEDSVINTTVDTTEDTSIQVSEGHTTVITSNEVTTNTTISSEVVVTYKVSGTVRSTEKDSSGNYQYLSGATCSLTGCGYAFTQSDGSFEFTNVVKGKLTLKIELTGYDVYEIDIEESRFVTDSVSLGVIELEPDGNTFGTMVPLEK